MMPSVISPEVKSSAERKIFEWFKDAPDTDDWIVLHSLGIAAHDKVIYGETDFLVLAPRLGIFALEVKGGRVKRENGIWHFIDRHNKTNSKSRGPYEQAKDGIFSIVKAIKERLDFNHKFLANILFGYGVMFPDIEYKVSGIDEEQWQVFDARNGRNVKEFIKTLSNGAKGKWEEKYGPLGESKLPNAADVKYLSSILRGDFDFAVSMRVQLQNSQDSLIKLTKEQYRCLDQLEDNPRCLIRGAAGTGKTILALEEAKKSIALGYKTAIFCYNAMLAEWFLNYFDSQPESLKPAFVGTLHKYMTQIVKGKDDVHFPRSQEDKDEYYRCDLPKAAVKVLSESSSPFDKIIVDESQDLITEEYLDVFDMSLRRGLDRGKWTMFGDFSMQAIYSDVVNGNTLVEMLEKRSSFIRFKLNINCRNTKPIGEEISTITGFKTPDDLWLKVDGMPVQYNTWETQEEEAEKLEAILQRLYKEGVNPELITVLSPKKREESIVSVIKGIDISNYKVPQVLKTTFSTIHSFKGLENTVIILVDIEDLSLNKLMYVGLSRACAGLFILESTAAKREYDSLFLRRLMNG